MSLPCSRSPLQALYRVFVVPAISPPPASRAASQQPRLNARPFSTSLPTRAKTRAPERRTQKWDDEITARQVLLVDATTGKLSETLHNTRELLAGLDPKTHRLVQMTRDDDASRPAGAPPVCKLVAKADIYQAARRKKEAAKEARRAGARGGEDAMKTLELNWAIDMNDLGHRLQRAREFLEEGRRVDVVLAAKKQGRKASRDECEKVLSRIKDVIESVPGAKEKAGGFEGKVGGLVKWTLLGKPPSTSAASQTARSVEVNGEL